MSFSSMNCWTAASSRSMPAMAAWRNLVTVMSFEAKYLVTAVSLAADKNLVTVTSKNLVTETSLVSRKRAVEVPRNFVTDISF